MKKVIIILSMIASFVCYGGDYAQNEVLYQRNVASFSTEHPLTFEERTWMHDREGVQQSDTSIFEFVLGNGKAVQYRVRAYSGMVNNGKYCRNTIHESFQYTINNSIQEDQILIELFDERNRLIETKTILIMKNEYDKYDISELTQD